MDKEYVKNIVKDLKAIEFGLDYIINGKELKQLADHITNLQQENERLKENRDWWKDRFFGQQEYDDSHRITAIEYKERIDKAIEYINVSIEEGNYFEDDIATDISEPTYDKYVNSSSLLKILQGSDEE